MVRVTKKKLLPRLHLLASTERRMMEMYCFRLPSRKETDNGSGAARIWERIPVNQGPHCVTMYTATKPAWPPTFQHGQRWISKRNPNPRPRYQAGRRPRPSGRTSPQDPPSLRPRCLRKTVRITTARSHWSKTSRINWILRVSSCNTATRGRDTAQTHGQTILNNSYCW